MDIKKVIIVAIFLTFLFLIFGLKYSGYVVHTFSSVRVRTGISVIYSEFTGSTTNFDSMNNSQLSNIAGMTLENPSYGKMVFQVPINLTQDSVDGIVNLNSNVEISSNSMEINLDNLESMDNPTILYFYNVDFQNPLVFRNGEECSSSYCYLRYYFDGVLMISVVNFSEIQIIEGPYCGDGSCQSESGEDCSNCPSDCSCSTEAPAAPPAESSNKYPGGGGAVTPPVSYKAIPKYVIYYNLFPFSLDRSFVKIRIKPGEKIRESVEIKNEEKIRISIKVTPLLIERFVKVLENNFSLGPGDSKIVTIEISAFQNETPDTHLGKLYINGKGVSELINVIIEVIELKPLFDVETKIIEREKIFFENKVKSKISVVNVGDLKNLDLDLYYAIKTSEGITLSFKEEKIAINDRIDLTRELDIPNGTSPGDYVFYSRVSYNNEIATSSDFFNIGESEEPLVRLPNYYIIIIIIAIIILFIIIRILRKRKEVSAGKMNLFRWLFIKRLFRRKKDDVSKI